MNTHVPTANLPRDLAEKVDAVAARIDRSRSWIVEQALAAWLAREDECDRMTREALAEVDTGHVIAHAAVLAWADSLSTDTPLLPPSA